MCVCVRERVWVRVFVCLVCIFVLCVCSAIALLSGANICGVEILISEVLSY